MGIEKINPEMAKSLIKKCLAKWLFFVLIYEGTFFEAVTPGQVDPKLALYSARVSIHAMNGSM